MKLFTESYRKGFPNEASLATFHQAAMSGNRAATRAAIKDAGADRAPTDSDVFAVNSPFLALYLQESSKVKIPEYGGGDHIRNIKFLRKAAGARDTPLDELGDEFPQGMKEVSGLLRESYFYSGQEHRPEFDCYKEGVDYMNNEKSFMSIMAGDAPQTSVKLGETREIKTGRDLGSYVHTDCMNQYSGAALIAFKWGVPFSKRMQEAMTGAAFGTLGFPAILYLLGGVLEAISAVSFRGKWEHLYPRPEQASYDLGLGLLSQMYPEGSPTHPSLPAMHTKYADAASEILLLIFEPTHVCPTGKTWRQEVELQRENVGLARLWSGVHYFFDHYLYRNMAKKVAREFFFNWFTNRFAK